MQSPLPSEPSAPEASPARRLRLRHPRACHMRSGSDFSRVYRSGVRMRGAHMLIVAAPRDGAENAPRLGLSVGRKYSKKAVVRNRCRRVFREAFRLARPQLPAFDLILIPFNGLHPLNALDCRDELVKLAGKAARKWEKRNS